MNGLFNPKAFFLAGVIVVLTGLALNYFQGMKGELRLVAGEAKMLVTESKVSADQDSSHQDLGMMITLDSLNIRQYTPEFEILVLAPDTSTGMKGNPPGLVINRFPLEEMKIHKVGETDFLFRHKELYPNFQFAYEYPANRDTIKPKAPGITLQLKTKEGMPMVTLRTDEPNKHTLKDIVSLGAPLLFFWEKSLDSVKAMVNSQGEMENSVVFSGADQKVFFIHNDTLTEQPLIEGTFYKMPGQDTVGFTVLYSFPDYAYLKAVPSTDGKDMLNPVAQVEVWKSGEGYRDAFIYPDRRGSKGGEYSIPASGYKLGLGEIREKALKHCDCFLSIQADSSQAPKSLALLSGRSATYKSYRFIPQECGSRGPGLVTISIVKKPGRNLLILGAGILFFSFLYLVFKKSRPQ